MSFSAFGIRVLIIPIQISPPKPIAQASFPILSLTIPILFPQPRLDPLASRFSASAPISGSEVSAITRYPVAFCNSLTYTPLKDCPDAQLITNGTRLFFQSGGETRRLPTTTYRTISGFFPRDELIEIAHGTGVASVAAAAKSDSLSTQSDAVHGVAFNAQIRALAFDSRSVPGFVSNRTPSDLSIRAQNQARENFLAPAILGFQTNGVDVVNMSFGYTGGAERYTQSEVRAAFPRTIAALAQANRPRADRTIYVVAAGNNRGRTMSDGNLAMANSPEILAALPYFAPELEGVMLAVVSVDLNINTDALGGGTPVHRINDFSNLCGVMRRWCLTAPGGNVLISSPTAYDDANQRTYRSVRSSGTSFAAPFVTGAIAALIDFFNGQLGNHEIVLRILATADKRGIYADAATYGQGLLDLKAASEPSGQGRLVMGATMSGASSSLRATRFYQSGAFGDALDFGRQWLSFFDELNAPFPIEINALVQSRQPAPAAIWAKRSLPFREARDGVALAFRPKDEAHDIEGAFFAETRFPELPNQSWFISYGVNPGHRLSAALDFSPARHSEFSAPWLAFADAGFALGGNHLHRPDGIDADRVLPIARSRYRRSGY